MKVMRTKISMHRQWPGAVSPLLSHVIRDIGVAARRFRRKPLVLLGACLQLALAIGGNTALFTVMNAVMFRPLPLREPEAVVALHVMRDGTNRGAFSLPMLLDVSASRRTLGGVAAYFQWSANLTDAGDAERLQAMRVTGNYLEVVGAEVALGRGVTSSDVGPESASTVVISDGLWKRRFGASSDVIGRTLRLNGEAFTVIGVLRSDFTFQVREAELLVPWVPERDPRRTNPALSFLRVVGRLAPGSGVPQAQAELDAHIAEFRRKYPDDSAADRAGRVVHLQEDIIGSVDRPLKMLAASMAVRDDDGRFRTVEIVGIVGDVKHFGLEAETPRELYVPLSQVPDTTSIWLANNMYWVVKTHGSPLSYAHAIRREVAAVDAEVASSFVRSMDQWLAQSVDTRRFNLRVIAAFAVTALLLAVIGVYCVAAEAVVVRTREMGVRAAIGATGPQLTAAIVKSGLGPVLGGVLVGAGIALATTRALSSSLYGVTPYDPVTFASVLLLVAAVGSLALYLPARRVARIDPVAALRTE